MILNHFKTSLDAVSNDKSFRGELVAQLPMDGDARDLLEEIERAKAGVLVVISLNIGFSPKF